MRAGHLRFGRVASSPRERRPWTSLAFELHRRSLRESDLPLRAPRSGVDASTSFLAGFEQLNGVARGIVEQDLLAAIADDDVVAKIGSRLAQGVEFFRICRSKSGPAPRSLCLLQNDEGIGWDPEVDPTVSGWQITAEVAHIVPAVDGGIAVEQFSPLPIGQPP